MYEKYKYYINIEDVSLFEKVRKGTHKLVIPKLVLDLKSFKNWNKFIYDINTIDITEI